MANNTSATSTENDISDAVNTAWVLLCTCLVFWEQAGFAMWEAGSLPIRSLHSILLKNMCDAAIAAAAFIMCGYAFAFGDGGSFIGHTHFLLLDVSENEYPTWFFQWAFAATAATTVSGCMAERTRFIAYLIYSFVITAFIYPIPVRWLWAQEGWLCAWGANSLFGLGMIDFAGSGVVHMLGGVAGLVGSKIVGPRRGRFEHNSDQSVFRGHSIALSTLGVYCLWFGWFGFNAGYTFGVTAGKWKTAALICINTTLSPAASVVACLAIEKCIKGFWDASAAMNAVVAGLVGITGPCGIVDPWAAAVIGLLSGTIYCMGWRFHERIRVDDPVHAIAVHAWPGAWGCIAPGLFANTKQLKALDYASKAGLFYSGSLEQLGVQLLATLVLFSWTVCTSAIVFYVLRASGLLRISAEEEHGGVDAAEHGQPLLGQPKHERRAPEEVHA